MYDHTCSKSKEQPGKVAKPARGQLNREHMNSSLSPFAPGKWYLETVSAVPSRVSLLISILSQTESGAYSHGVPHEFRGGIDILGRS